MEGTPLPPPLGSCGPPGLDWSSSAADRNSHPRQPPCSKEGGGVLAKRLWAPPAAEAGALRGPTGSARQARGQGSDGGGVFRWPGSWRRPPEAGQEGLSASPQPQRGRRGGRLLQLTSTFPRGGGCGRCQGASAARRCQWGGRGAAGPASRRNLGAAALLSASGAPRGRGQQPPGPGGRGEEGRPPSGREGGRAGASKLGARAFPRQLKRASRSLRLAEGPGQPVERSPPASSPSSSRPGDRGLLPLPT